MVKIGKFEIRPEVTTGTYWVHIGIIALMVLLILKYVFNHDMLSFDMFWKLGITIAASDVFAHSILGFD